MHAPFFAEEAASAKEEFRQRRGTAPDVETRRKTEAVKVKLAVHLRNETVMTLDWMAARWRMGRRHTVVNCLKG